MLAALPSRPGSPDARRAFRERGRDLTTIDPGRLAAFEEDNNSAYCAPPHSTIGAIDCHNRRVGAVRTRHRAIAWSASVNNLLFPSLRLQDETTAHHPSPDVVPQFLRGALQLQVLKRSAPGHQNCESVRSAAASVTHWAARSSYFGRRGQRRCASVRTPPIRAGAIRACAPTGTPRTSLLLSSAASTFLFVQV